MVSLGLYDARFDPAERRAKNEVWRILCTDFLQRYVPPDAIVIDLGAGFCEFINQIRAAEKWAVDMEDGVRTWAAPDVHVHCGPAHDLGWRSSASVDVVFASNVFEHFSSKADVLTALCPCWMASPLAVSQILGDNRQHFDVVVFDEASQVLPEDAIAAILRGRSLVVAGDPHQLPPTQFFAADREEDHEGEAEETEGFESILDERVHGFGGGDVQLDHQRPASGGYDRVTDRPHIVRIGRQPAERDISAGSREGNRGRGAYA